MNSVEGIELYNKQQKTILALICQYQYDEKSKSNNRYPYLYKMVWIHVVCSSSEMSFKLLLRAIWIEMSGISAI